MSQIFDALQKSEAERSGIDTAALSKATEILRRVELDANSKWGTGKGVADPGLHGSSIDEVPLEIPKLSTAAAVAAVEPAPAPAAVVASGSPEKVFEQFKPIKIALSAQSRLVSVTDSDHRAAEAFRLLGVRLREVRRVRPFKKILITSTIPQEGKSTVSANLACTFARTPQQRTLLLEGDLRRPTLSKIFGTEGNSGLCEFLRGEKSLSASIYHLDPPGLWFLPAGDCKENALGHLQSAKLPYLIDQLMDWFDWIIIDSPPVLPLADTSIWMRLTDGALLVARQGITERRQLQRGLDALDPQKLIGAILNSSKYSPHSDYYYRPAAPSQQDKV